MLRKLLRAAWLPALLRAFCRFLHRVLTVVGTVRLTRSYYFCAHCAIGQYPVDVELVIAGLESSRGVRRMEAVVGSEMPIQTHLRTGASCVPVLGNTGMISRANRRNCSLPPEIVNSTYFAPALFKASSMVQILSGVP